MVEFEHAAPGTIGLEAMFGVLMTLFPLEKNTPPLNQRKKNGLVYRNPKSNWGEKAWFKSFLTQTDLPTSQKRIFTLAQRTVSSSDRLSRGKVYGSIHGDKQMIL